MATSRLSRLLGRRLVLTRNGSCLGNARCNSTSAAIQEHEEEVTYPPIKPRFPPGEWGNMRDKTAWKWHEDGEALLKHDTVRKRLRTFSEEPKNIYKVNGIDRNSEILPYRQFITKTALVDGLPELYSDINVDNNLEVICSRVKDAILANQGLLDQTKIYQYRNRPYTSELHPTAATHNFLSQLVNIVLASTSAHFPHLLTAQVDERARVESFWYKGGYQLEEEGPPTHNIAGVYRRDALRMYYRNTPNFQIRTELPLSEFCPMDAAICTEGDYSADFVKNPAALGQFRETTSVNNFAGHRIGDPCEFGQVSFHSAEGNGYNLKIMEEKFGDDELQNMMKGNGVVCNFGWLVAQAHNQGFSMFHDLTYPLTSQAVITNGQRFWFSAYQLNTISLFKDDIANPRRNICWTAPEMKLYETIENGQVKGFNEEVMKTVLKFMLNQPTDRGINMRPFLPDRSVAPSAYESYMNEAGDDRIFHVPEDVCLPPRGGYPRTIGLKTHI